MAKEKLLELTQEDLGPIPFEEVACHNCRPNCKYETPALFQGRQTVICANRFLDSIEVLEHKKKSGPPVAVIIGICGIALMLIIATIVSQFM